MAGSLRVAPTPCPQSRRRLAVALANERWDPNESVRLGSGRWVRRSRSGFKGPAFSFRLTSNSAVVTISYPESDKGNPTKLALRGSSRQVRL